MRNRGRTVFFQILILLIAITTAGCAKKTSKDVRIILETPDGIETTDTSSDAVFPRFVSNDEEFQKQLDKLNKETEKVRKEYFKRTEKDKEYVVHTYLGSSERVPQCTVCWYEEHSLLDDDYNLMTLAYNKNTDEIMTSKEALNSLQIDGITLSTTVAKLYQSLGLPGKLTETEMQGFVTDDAGKVTDIFMKLIIESEDLENSGEKISERHFYNYSIEADTLRPLYEYGYDMP